MVTSDYSLYNEVKWKYNQDSVNQTNWILYYISCKRYVINNYNKMHDGNFHTFFSRWLKKNQLNSSTFTNTFYMKLCLFKHRVQQINERGVDSFTKTWNFILFFCCYFSDFSEIVSMMLQFRITTFPLHHF